MSEQLKQAAMQYIKYAAITSDTVRAAWENAAALQAATKENNYREIARLRRAAHGKGEIIATFFKLCDNALAKYKALAENQ